MKEVWVGVEVEVEVEADAMMKMHASFCSFLLHTAPQCVGSFQVLHQDLLHASTTIVMP